MEPRFTPRMDVTETKNGLEIALETPGMGPEQIKVTSDEGVLTISGEKTESAEKSQGDRHLTERSFGRFSRSIHLSRAYDAAGVTASMKDGVLRLNVPRHRGAEAQTIPIQSQ